MIIKLKEGTNVLHGKTFYRTDASQAFEPIEIILTGGKTYRLFFDSKLESILKPVNNEMHLFIKGNTISYDRGKQ